MQIPFERIVAQHGATVLRLCRAMVGVQDADDAWSETFLSALRGYAELPGDTNVEAWLVTIARRRCVDALRARGRRPEPVAAIADAAAPAAGLSFDLVRALATLTDRQRTAVVLHFLVGLPHVAVARETDTTPEAARKASSDGIRALRTVYRGDLT